jgi:hypothetical protein
MEGRTLHPERDGAGVWLFSSSEVDRLATQRTAKPRVRAASDDAGVIAGRAFELFDEGCDLREIVVDLRQTPHVIRELYNEWLLDLETGRADAQREKDEREYERMVGAFAPSTRGRDRAERQSTSKS